MDKAIGALISVLIVAIIFGLMLWGWRARSQRAGSIVMFSVASSPDAREYAVFYVATTRADNFLERVNLPGFAFRGYGTVVIDKDAVVCELLSGERLCIPAHQFRGSMRTTTVIDKVVEKDGLQTIVWETTTRSESVVELATHLRLVRPSDLGSFNESMQALRSIPTSSSHPQ